MQVFQVLHHYHFHKADDRTYILGHILTDRAMVKFGCDVSNILQSAAAFVDIQELLIIAGCLQGHQKQSRLEETQCCP